MRPTTPPTRRCLSGLDVAKPNLYGLRNLEPLNIRMLADGSPAGWGGA